MADIREIPLPPGARERDRTQLAKLGLLWGAWILAIVAVHRLVASGAIGIAAAALVAAATGTLVVAGIGFLGHDIAHGSVVAGERAMRIATFFSLTAVLFVPYFLWVRWHNAFHHRYANTPRDSDRLLRHDEIGAGVASYALYRALNLAGLSLQYVAGRVWKSVYRTKGLGDRKKRADVISLALLAILHLTVFAVLPLSTWWVGVVLPLAFGLVTVSYYIQSNHFDRPQTARPDPVGGSSDVSVPAVVDWLHSNFSRHTAHHCFPAVASRHYPAITRDIRRLFPEEYRCEPFLSAAWRNATSPKIVRDGRWLVGRTGVVHHELT